MWVVVSMMVWATDGVGLRLGLGWLSAKERGMEKGKFFPSGRGAQLRAGGHL